jgi:hypothetical protein
MVEMASSSFTVLVQQQVPSGPQVPLGSLSLVEVEENERMERSSPSPSATLSRSIADLMAFPQPGHD